MTHSEDAREPLLGGQRVDSRPEHIGPGYWRAIRDWAYVHDTSTLPSAREMFIDNLVRGTAGHFECLHCRAHALEYMTHTDPIRNILKLPKTGPDGVKPLMVCSAWAYRFHEAVNERLKKPKEQRPTFAQVEQYHAELRSGKGCSDCGPIGSIRTVQSAPIIHRQLVD